MRKLISVFAIAILTLTVLCLGGYGVALAVEGKHVKGLGEPIRRFVYFPRLAAEVLTSQETRSIPLSLIPSDDGYEPGVDDVNLLTEDLYGLMAFFNDDPGRWEIALENYRNGARIKTWPLPVSLFEENTGRQYMASRPKHAMLLPDGSLLVNFSRSKNLLRLGPEGNLLWANRDMLYHHAMNLDDRGRLWVCATPYAGDLPDPLLNYTYQNADGKQYAFRDDHLVAIDVATGALLEDHSIAGILAGNDRFGLLVGHRDNDDPIHLNDIQPALESGPYWNKGDLFFSAKHMSAVVHYRPSTEEVIKVIDGPLVHQHDVDIIDDHRVAIFNNNYSTSGAGVTGRVPDDELRSSSIVVYDYRTDSLSTIYEGVMRRGALHTPTAGQFRLLENGNLWLDLDDFGRILVVDSTGVIFSTTYPSRHAGYKHLTSWPRVYETLPPNL